MNTSSCMPKIGEFEPYSKSQTNILETHEMYYGGVKSSMSIYDDLYLSFVTISEILLSNNQHKHGTDLHPRTRCC